MLPDTLLSPEYSLAALILAVEVLGVLHVALLEAAAFLSIKSKQIVLPGILGYIVGHRLLHPHALWIMRSAIGMSWG